MKYVITGDLIKKYQNDDGIVFMNVFDFLLGKFSIEVQKFEGFQAL